MLEVVGLENLISTHEISHKWDCRAYIIRDWIRASRLNLKIEFERSRFFHQTWMQSFDRLGFSP